MNTVRKPALSGSSSVFSGKEDRSSNHCIAVRCLCFMPKHDLRRQVSDRLDARKLLRSHIPVIYGLLIGNGAFSRLCYMLHYHD
jgi:hypothetical protein